MLIEKINDSVPNIIPLNRALRTQKCDQNPARMMKKGGDQFPPTLTLGPQSTPGMYVMYPVCPYSAAQLRLHFLPETRHVTINSNRIDLMGGWMERTLVLELG